MAATIWHFTGCGLLGGYYLGVRSALRRRGVPRSLYDASASRLAGASAGSLAAAAVVSDASAATTMNVFEKIAEEVRVSTILGCNVLERVRREVDSLLPEDAHERCTGRLAVLITDASSAWAPKLLPVEHFATRAELVDALLISCYVPGLFSPPTLTSSRFASHSSRLVDGGMADAAPWLSQLGVRAVRVAPFGGDFDVSPTSHRGGVPKPPIRVPVFGDWLDASPANAKAAWHAWSPLPELASLYRQGFDDCHRFLRSECPSIIVVPYCHRTARERRRE
jgi:hypothetical protein